VYDSELIGNDSEGSDARVTKERKAVAVTGRLASGVEVKNAFAVQTYTAQILQTPRSRPIVFNR
jgi:hypothetical protein